MEIKLQDLPKILENLIKKSGKLKRDLCKELNIGDSTLWRITTSQRGMSKPIAKLFNDYFEVPYFTPYQVKDGIFEAITTVSKCKTSNKFKPGNTVLNLLNQSKFIVTEIKFNKSKQEWVYLYNSEWIEEFYLKDTKLVSITEITPEEYVQQAKEIDTLDKDEIEEPKEFVIPQIKYTPEESIKESIEKIDNKDSIKSILTDVVTRLINLL